MKIVNLFKVALRSLNKNKFRTFLTMLGIIIGVASVIAMLAIGQGSKENIKSSIASLGTNTIMIFPGAFNQGGVRMGAGTVSTLTKEDAATILKRVDLVDHVVPVVSKMSQIIYANQNWRTNVSGSYNDYFLIRDLKIILGNMYSDADERSAAKVCVIGQTVVTNLMGEGTNPIGKTIRINSIPFKIIGMLDKKGQNSFGQDQDDIIIAPFNTVQKRMLQTLNVNMILCSGISSDVIDDATAEIAPIMREMHKLAPTDDNDFTIRTQQDIANIFGSISKVLTILLASIASISLVVGGIGIMNIMLVSVTERTREIGIRLAVGAKSRDVLLQFMIESIFISIIGGAIGILLGILISNAVSHFGGWPVSITLSSIVLSSTFSAAIGVFFGWYPARKAAALNPIDALRYE